MNVKVVSLSLLILFAFSMITTVIMAFEVQLHSRVTTLRAVSYSDNPGHEPAGDPVDNPASPRSSFPS